MTMLNMKGSIKFGFSPLFLFMMIGFPSIHALAQEKGQSKSFDDIKVERIRVADLPQPEESVIPSQLAQLSELPKLPKFEDLRQAQQKAFPNIVEILALQKPIGSLQKHGILVKGHGVWIQTKGEVQLVSAGHWLENAESIFLDLEKKEKDYNPLVAKKEAFGARKYGQNPLKQIEKNPERYLKIKVSYLDKHRNVVVLKSKEKTKDSIFEKAKPIGFVLFDFQNEFASRIYGMSPYQGNVFVESLMFPPQSKETYISYYLQTTFLGILGAPLVSSTGKLIAITAHPHPTKKQTSLVIPPLALQNALLKSKGLDPKLKSDAKKKD